MEDKVLKRWETAKVIRGVEYRYENLIVQEPSGQRRYTSRCLGRRDEELQQDEGIRIPASQSYELLGLYRGQFVPSEGELSADLRNCDGSPPEANSESLSVGAVVHHRLNRELVGRIISLDTTSARIELLTWPDTWWRDMWGTRPVPVLTENLELAE